MMQALVDRLYNVGGWSTNQKLVVFEVDDYGTIRIPDKNSLLAMQSRGVPVGKRRFSALDGLESNLDLENLFEVLTSVKDSLGRHAVFTPMTLVANPDFGKIEQTAFTRYYYEPVDVTYKKTQGSERCMDLWNQGIEQGIFMPQFHGREHVNVNKWLDDLQSGQVNTRLAFGYKTFGVDEAKTNQSRRKDNYMVSFEDLDERALTFYNDAIKDGLNLFEKLFGYRATIFTPPNGEFPLSLEPFLAQSGIQSIVRPRFGKLRRGKRSKFILFPGGKSSSGLRYQIRNAQFEIVGGKTDTAIALCMKAIDTAFSNRKPAIISSHRVNFVSRIDSTHSANGLKALRTMLHSIVSKWPDVQFVSSSRLLQLMTQNVSSK